MTWPIHILFGISTLWLLAGVRPEVLQFDFGVLATAAALLPDLDASQSKIKHLRIPNTSIKPFLPLSIVVSMPRPASGAAALARRPAHVTLLCLPAAGWVGWTPIVALLLGYASHLIADATTKSDLRLLYLKTQRFYILPQRWKSTTVSIAKEVVATLFVGSSVSILLYI